VTDLGTVLVTGGSAGLGAAVVDAVAGAGGTPIVLDLHVPAAAVEYEAANLADTDATTEIVERVVGRHPEMTGVVNAAGIDCCGRLEDVPAAAWEQVIRVNLLGTAAVVRAALPTLEATGGAVVMVASTLGLRAVSDATAYCASKFGVVGFTRALAAETANRVGVTLLVPGGMNTSFFDEREAQYRPPRDAKLNRPEDVAAAVVFALRQPPGCEIRELVVCPSTESSWP
jgi:NAD(P)-dependent dehydrogenase (short-subunit alcohol dehydrogenase family)